MIDELIKPELAPEKKLQPPARWRCWWRINQVLGPYLSKSRRLIDGEYFRIRGDA